MLKFQFFFKLNYFSKSNFIIFLRKSNKKILIKPIQGHSWLKIRMRSEYGKLKLIDRYRDYPPA